MTAVTITAGPFAGEQGVVAAGLSAPPGRVRVQLADGRLVIVAAADLEEAT